MSTTSWRSTKSFTSTARRSASSGGSSDDARREAQARQQVRGADRQLQPTGGVARRDQQQGPPLAGEIEEVEQGRPRRRSARSQILDDQGAVRDEMRHLSVRDLEGVDGPGVGDCAAQIAARWLLPLPAGPSRRRIVSGQSGQLSIERIGALVRGADEEILAAEARLEGQLEGELLRRLSHRDRAGGPRPRAAPARASRRDRAGLRGSCCSAKRASTPTAAASGTASSSPTKPNSEPKAKSANISQTGCSPTDSPTSFGERMLPSTNCPTTKIAERREDPGPVGPELHERDADREEEPGERADIGDEAQEARRHADQGAEIQPDQPRARRHRRCRG